MTSFQERVGAFERGVIGPLGLEHVRLHRAFGVSNSAKVIEGGIQLAGVNLERFSPPAAFVLCSCLRFAPSDEVLFAVVVRADLPALERRLVDMRSRGESEAGTGEGKAAFAARNNNVVVYLAPGGRLLLRNKGYWEALTLEDAETQGPVTVDEIHVSCSTGSRPGSSGRGAQEFVRYLDVLAGDARVVDHTVHPPARSLRSWGVIELRRLIEAFGGYHPDGGIEGLHQGLCLGSPGMVAIVQGPAGAGKSFLACRYAEAIGADVVASTGREGSAEELIRVASLREPASLRPQMLLLDGVTAEEAARAARTWRSARGHGLPVVAGEIGRSALDRQFLVVTLDGAEAAPSGLAPVVALPSPDISGFVHHLLRRSLPWASGIPASVISGAKACRSYAEAEALLTSPR